MPDKTGDKCDACGAKLVACNYKLFTESEAQAQPAERYRYDCKVRCGHCGHWNVRVGELPGER